MYLHAVIVHAHVCFIATDICLVLIAAHQEDFYQMADCRNAVVQVRFSPGLIYGLFLTITGRSDLKVERTV